MATGNYPVAVVLINRHEPEGEVAGRLMELAEDNGYDVRAVEAQRGEHDVPLSFRVPQDVADAFNSDRDERWPETGGDDEERKVAGVDGDAYEADSARTAQETRAANAADTGDDTNTPARKTRAGKA